MYRDWHHQQEIQVAMPPANRLPKQQRIPKSNDVLLAVRTLVREKRSRNERVVARHVLDLMRQRMWLVVDDQDPKADASSLRCARRYLNTVIVTMRNDVPSSSASQVPQESSCSVETPEEQSAPFT